MKITENPQFKLTDYEVIWFACNNGINRKQKAYKVGNWLVVSYNAEGKYKVYRIDTGKPLLNSTFDTDRLAVEFAQAVSDIFETYFDIWSIMPDADIFGMAKWSIKNGIDLYEIVKSLPPRIKTVEDIKQVEDSKSLKDKVGEWYGRLIRRSV